jgi:hypothetical protein
MITRLPQQIAKFTLLQDTSLPYGQWWIYPSGAHITLLDGSLSLYVLQLEDRGWVVESRPTFGGGLRLAENLETCEAAMQRAECWLLDQLRTLQEALHDHS